MAYGFSRWEKWCDRNEIDRIHLPGIYALALPNKDIAGSTFSWTVNIVYFGMTNSKGGLKSRLQAFENTIKGGRGHGGAQRVRFKHRDYLGLSKRLFVSICPCDCNVSSNKPRDLKLMGRVAKHE